MQIRDIDTNTQICEMTDWGCESYVIDVKKEDDTMTFPVRDHSDVHLL